MALANSAFDLAGNVSSPPPYLVNSNRKLVEAALALLANNGQSEGMHGLVARFRQAGLQHIVESWIGAGQNMPLSGDDLQRVLDEGHLKQIAEETGYTEEDAAARLGGLLPAMVDQLTPAGRLPEDGLGNLSELRERYTA